MGVFVYGNDRGPGWVPGPGAGEAGSVGGSSRTADSTVLDTAVKGAQTTFLDGAKSAPRTLDADPCQAHDHPSPDIPCALGGWFLSRSDAQQSAVRLVTLTFDPRRLASHRPGAPRDFVGIAAARTAFGRWYREGLIAADPAGSVLLGLEAHKSGARHGHALIVTARDTRWEGMARYWFQHYGASQGFDELVRVEDASARYAAKYAGKELGVYGVAFGGGRLDVI